LYSTKFPNFLQ